MPVFLCKNCEDDMDNEKPNKVTKTTAGADRKYSFLIRFFIKAAVIAALVILMLMKNQNILQQRSLEMP